MPQHAHAAARSVTHNTCTTSRMRLHSHTSPSVRCTGVSAAAPGLLPKVARPASTRVESLRNSGLGSSKPLAQRDAGAGQHAEPVSEPGPWRQAASVCAAAVTAVCLLQAAVPEPVAAISTEQLLFLEAWRAVDRAYVDKSFNGQGWFRVREQYLKQEDMSNRQHTYDAVRKLLATLDDPFTRFLEPARLERLRGGTGGQVTGVGVEVSLDEAKKGASELVVVAPVPGGPVEQAGVRSGDVITAVDGKPTRGISLYEASDLLQGQEGTQVTLTIQPGGKGASKDITITRQRVTVNPVLWGVCSSVSPSVTGGSGGGKLGYIKVSTFSSQTVPKFLDALEQLKSQGGTDRVVMDLRNNGGGSFPAGVQLGKLLLERGDIVLIADSQGVRDIVSADGGNVPALPTAPLAVIVNKGTASASEVLAGALKDNKRATIVGSENTFGKGLIQTIVDLSDGSGVAITVARYQTPSGTDINKVGITPDIRLPAEQLPPSGPEAFCSALTAPDAPRLFM